MSLWAQYLSPIVARVITMSSYDAFLFGVCVGFVAVFPVAIVLHFVARLISNDDIKDHEEQYP